MKTIVVQWVEADPKSGYTEEMRVMVSEHPRFTLWSRFDFGFFKIATSEGYTIVSLPKSLR